MIELKTADGRTLQTTREACLAVHSRVNPIIQISKLIDEHSYTRKYNQETCEWDFVKNKENMDNCSNKDCDICKVIKLLSDMSIYYSLGRTAKTPLSKLHLGHYGKIFAMGLTLEHFSELMDSTVEELSNRVDYFIETSSDLSVYIALREHEIPAEYIQTLMGINEYGLRQLREESSRHGGNILG